MKLERRGGRGESARSVQRAGYGSVTDLVP
jgi:hypothetical protein